jgi:hypothetical protein
MCCGLVSSRSEQQLLQGSCELGNKLLSSLKYWEILEKLGEW